MTQPTERNQTELDDESFAHINQGLIRLLTVAAIAGVAVGLVGGSFHWLLVHGGAGFLETLAHWKEHGIWGLPGWIAAMAVVGTSVALARWLVTFAPSSAGSGVQHVEAVMREQAQPAPFRVLPIKYVGGLLAMVPGLALGREGPTIQMAAVIGTQCGKIFRLAREDRFMMYTAVAGSGLSVAFNAPLAGAAFVLEEVARRVTARRLLVTLVAVATAMAVYRGYFGNDVEFDVSEFLPATPTEFIVYALFGGIMGALGVAYNKSVLFGLNSFSNIAPTVSPIAKAGVIGAALGLLAYYQPNLVGGGELQANMVLAGQFGIGGLLLLFAVRWVLGPISYSMGTPGGLFAPLLLVGAVTGALFAHGANVILPTSTALTPAAFALVGMAAFFTAVVRAPFTGVLLITEMSGSVDLVIPMVVAGVTATVMADLMKGEPIYDSLRARMPVQNKD
ncbi:ClC family H(+)/Cl(-) exchange transporter [Orrella daihaiensis]|uniref:ClC family H(+)/Cl(-) exchange transporter n=1 Tax=Orrella daihaiensis TaxID=2782176 RepID=A0ABY4AL16_9BURK|nr:ClC family H(+)/Cl(-) exchange transporter [Orrella daihaiensis]UOD49762.1 ClC family H(+)/Cl(-) exchange transporter [Orrella daihaiensis]